MNNTLQSPQTGSRSLTPNSLKNRDNLLDLRFRQLVNNRQWEQLPAAVQRRFSKRLDAGDTAVYTGITTTVRTSTAGKFLAWITRLIGGPLPYALSTGTAATVTVTEDPISGGQIWTRVYARTHQFPQVIHSIKRFQGATGLEEYIGYGIGMALKVHCSVDGIRFHSDHYFIQLGKRRLRLPRWLSPGKVLVSHLDRDAGQFLFVLQVEHPWLGELIYQEARFADLLPENGHR